MREYAAAHDWLTIIQLPSYAPDLNPVEGVWSLLRRGPPANTAFTDDEHLERTLRRGLRHIQLQPALIDGCLARTRLTLTQQPTTTRGSQ
ncbi:transposase [Streptomyces sviceus]|uniref:transposase n=1 Tax=Streptomyces sviceus TaxID=285530 RepID=UPI0036AA8714